MCDPGVSRFWPFHSHRPEFDESPTTLDATGPPQYDQTAYDEPNLDPSTVVCPPHTTESKLIYRIDLHVIPFLCIMYLLAFLDR